MIVPIIYISTFLFVAYTIILALYKQGLQQLPPPAANQPFFSTSVSIIVAARNEAHHLKNCLSALLAQHYPKELLEIMVVDDHSDDGTLAIAQQFPQLRVLRLAEGEQGKKAAITMAVSHASGKLIVTTDADCTMGQDWLPTIVSAYEQVGAKMLMAPVKLSPTNNLLEIWQAMDMAGLMSITAGSIAINFPQMCNGANLAYEKEAFLSLGGYDAHTTNPSGDDVLLMFAIKKKYPNGLHFMMDEKAVVSTAPQISLKALLMQRIRWISKAGALPKKVTAVLVLSYLFNLMVVVNLLVAFAYPAHWMLFGLLLVMKTVIEFPLLYRSLRLFGQQKLLWWLPLVQPLHVLYATTVGLLALIWPYEWKGRRYP
ncbi:MAG: glycosyltransferase [Chitinophagales bacterium]|nr:glycosyltransferase [Chitinophagales bacterium]